MRSPRAQHLIEMQLALDRGCSLPAARKELARTRHYAGEEALRKVRGIAATTASADPMNAADAQQRFWWNREDDDAR